VASGYRGGAAVGPEGAVAGGSRVGAASTPYGTGAYGTRYGAAASGTGAYRAGYGTAAAAVRPYGTAYTSSAALATQGTAVRAAYGGYGAFTPSWYGNYTGAWTAAALTASSAYANPGWGALAAYCGYAQQPVPYDYGGNVVTQADTMYVNGDPSGTPQQYASQASQIASTGRAAQADPNGQWQPLGVFAMIPSGETSSNELFQLAINPQGVIRGNYHNAQTNQTLPVSGSVDKKTMRAAWTVGQDQTPVFEAGISNLTKDETTMLMYDASNQPQQFNLIRLPAPDAGGPATGAGDGQAPQGR
jgi:hypothetical protein